MIASLRFRPLGSGYACAQERLAPRKMHALPILSVAAVGAVKGGAFSDVRIVAGPVADRPLRLRDVEAFLEGRPAEAAVAREAGALAAQLCHPRGSPLRGSAECRQHLVGVLVRRALERIAGSAEGGEGWSDADAEHGGQ